MGIIKMGMDTKFMRNGMWSPKIPLRGMKANQNTHQGKPVRSEELGLLYLGEGVNKLETYFAQRINIPQLMPHKKDPLTNPSQIGTGLGEIETEEGLKEFFLLNVGKLLEYGLDLETIVDEDESSRSYHWRVFKVKDDGTLLSMSRSNQKRLVSMLQEKGLNDINFLSYPGDKKSLFYSRLNRRLLETTGQKLFTFQMADGTLGLCYMNVDLGISDEGTFADEEGVILGWQSHTRS